MEGTRLTPLLRVLQSTRGQAATVNPSFSFLKPHMKLASLEVTLFPGHSQNTSPHMSPLQSWALDREARLHF